MPVIAKRLQTKETVQQMINAFKVFDKENRGTLHPWELKHILSHFGEIMEEGEIDEYIAEADTKARPRPCCVPDCCAGAGAALTAALTAACRGGRRRTSKRPGRRRG